MTFHLLTNISRWSVFGQLLKAAPLHIRSVRTLGITRFFAAMLRSLPAVMLVGLLFSNIFLKSAILLDFKVNQELISTTLCIKKDVAENTCNGKCHLSKQLEKSEDRSEEAPVLPENLKEVLLFFKVDVPIQWNMIETKALKATRIRPLQGIDVYHAIFHPPQVV